MRQIAAALVVVLISSTGQAQFPIGHGTPVGSYSPSLFADPVWLGNPDYGYRIGGAPPGGAALVVISSGRLDQTVIGLQVYPDLASVVVLHPAVVDGNGNATIPLPLPGPDQVALAGLDFYAQAAVTDPGSGGFGSTQGLLLEVVLHPLFAFATAETSLVLLDPLAGTTTTVTGFPAGTIFNDAVFGNGGADLFVSTNSGLFVVDTLAATPGPVLLLPGIWKWLVWDRVFNRIFAIFPFFGLAYIIDGDHSSATFGTIIGQTGASPGATRSAAISADGRILAAVNDFGDLNRTNVDPTSSAYLQQIPTFPMPVFTFGATVDRVRMSPDGRVASVAVTDPFLAPPTKVHRNDGTTGMWINHSVPFPFGAAPLSSLTVPGVPASFNILASNDGSHWVLMSTGSVVRLDFDLDSPLTLAATTTSVAPPTSNLAYVSLSPSGRYLVQRDWTPMSGPSANVISLVDVTTGVVTPWVTLMGASSSTAATVTAWR